MHSTTLPLSLLTLFLLLLATGCAKQDHIRTRTLAHAYTQPCQQVRAETRKALFTRGFAVKDSDEVSLETEWKQDSSAGPTRYLVQTMDQADGACTLQINRVQRSIDSDSVTTSRDWDMEWHVLQQVDPEVAAAIEAEAEREANK